MAVPFAKLTDLAAVDKKEREVREVLFKFAKIVANKNARSVMRDYDDRMQNLPLESAADTFMGCLTDSNLSADLYICSSKPSILQLLKSDYKTCKDITPIMHCFAKSAVQGHSAIVLFNVSHLGLFVGTNMSLNPAAVPRLVVHGSKSGIDAIQYFPIKSFEQEYNKNFNKE